MFFLSLVCLGVTPSGVQGLFLSVLSNAEALSTLGSAQGPYVVPGIQTWIDGQVHYHCTIHSATFIYLFNI